MSDSMETTFPVSGKVESIVDTEGIGISRDWVSGMVMV